MIGIRKGRGGLGAIFVWATGNGGHYNDYCNCDGYITSIFTVSVGAVNDRGKSPWYAEPCPSTLAVTYSSGASEGNDKQIVTTDLRRSCTKSHTGTSAAAPLAAGWYFYCLSNMSLVLSPVVSSVEHVIDSSELGATELQGKVETFSKIPNACLLLKFSSAGCSWLCWTVCHLGINQSHTNDASCELWLMCQSCHPPL